MSPSDREDKGMPEPPSLDMDIVGSDVMEQMETTKSGVAQNTIEEAGIDTERHGQESIAAT